MSNTGEAIKPIAYVLSSKIDELHERMAESALCFIRRNPYNSGGTALYTEEQVNALLDKKDKQIAEWRDAAEHWKDERKLREHAYPLQGQEEELLRQLYAANAEIDRLRSLNHYAQLESSARAENKALKEFIIARQEYDKAIKPDTGLGHPKKIAYTDPIVQRVLRAMEAIPHVFT